MITVFSLWVGGRDEPLVSNQNFLAFLRLIILRKKPLFPRKTVRAKLAIIDARILGFLLLPVQILLELIRGNNLQALKLVALLLIFQDGGVLEGENLLISKLQIHFVPDSEAGEVLRAVVLGLLLCLCLELLNFLGPLVSHLLLLLHPRHSVIFVIAPLAKSLASQLGVENALLLGSEIWGGKEKVMRDLDSKSHQHQHHLSQYRYDGHNKKCSRSSQIREREREREKRTRRGDLLLKSPFELITLGLPLQFLLIQGIILLGSGLCFPL